MGYMASLLLCFIVNNPTFGSSLLRQAAEEKIIKIGKNKEKRYKSNTEPSLLGLC
jgi:hypothetical protein